METRPRSGEAHYLEPETDANIRLESNGVHIVDAMPQGEILTTVCDIQISKYPNI
jgi:hypothetical protein